MRYINCENLVKKYGRNSAQVSAVSHMNLTIDLGEFVGIMGDSGAGKSTLLSIMGAMNAPTSGRYVVDDIDVYSLNSEQQADFRREFLGFVFQNFHLIPYLTVLENTMLPLTTVKAGRHRKREMAEEALNSVGLSGKENRLPSQISGGDPIRCQVAHRCFLF